MIGVSPVTTTQTHNFHLYQTIKWLGRAHYSQESEVCLSSKNYRFPAGWFQTSLYNASDVTQPNTLDGFYPFNIYRTWTILENLKIASQLDFSFHISMIVLSLPHLLCFISSFALVVPFKLKIKDIWLQKSNNNKYLLNVDSTPSQIDTWYILLSFKLRLWFLLE